MAATGWPEAERAAREAYGRLVAWLAWQWRDLAAAEDAMSEALLKALTLWPVQGVPTAPDAWLLSTARRELLQQHRRQQLAQSPEVLALFEAEPEAPSAPTLPDRRLELLFTCAHPALPAAVHTPLMLQAVLGLDAKAIARAFLVPPAAMAQRLVRAKAKIREAGIGFHIPEAAERQGRLGAVLEGIYGAYTLGSELAAPATPAAGELREEALFLARLVATAQADSAEALGLLSLLLYCEARRPAQFDAAGDFVPLTRQDTALWNHAQLREAEALMWQAARLRAPGPLQLEAAIQSAHSQRAASGQTPWAQIAQLYGVLVAQHGGSVGARLAQAVALAESGQLEAAQAALAALPEDRVQAHQPYWLALAHVQRQAGDRAGADAAMLRALALTTDERLRRFLEKGAALHKQAHEHAPEAQPAQRPGAVTP